MLGGVGGRLRARIAKTRPPLEIPVPMLRCRPAPLPQAVLGERGQEFYEVPIAVGVVLEARAVGDSGVGCLARQRWARSTLTRAVAACFPIRKPAC